MWRYFVGLVLARGTFTQRVVGQLLIAECPPEDEVPATTLYALLSGDGKLMVRTALQNVAVAAVQKDVRQRRRRLRADAEALGEVASTLRALEDEASALDAENLRMEAEIERLQGGG